MPVQIANNYPELQGVGIEGACADLTPKSVVTGFNESEAMPFGRMVQFDSTGTSDRSVKLANASGGGTYGITYFTQFQDKTVTLLGIAQVSTVTIGGTPTDGTYSFTIAGETITVVRAAGAPAGAIPVVGQSRTF